MASETVQRVGKVLAEAVRLKASDVHFRVGHPPMIRMTGDLTPVDLNPFTREEMHEIAERITPPLLREEAKQEDQIDFSVEWQGASRFRVHRFKSFGEPALVMRIIPLDIPDFASLRLPPAVKKIADLERGLVLVTGATGQGKSTTIASVLQFIADTQNRHIVTIEDPVEFIIKPGKSLLSQREVGNDVSSFDSGLWAALREDPDIVFIGEIRDLNTVRVALLAAEKGHLIFSTIHTVDVTSTIEHIISLFPQLEQQAARTRLASSLQVVLSQRLLPMKGLKQRVLATEVMLRAGGIQEYIRKSEGKRSLLEKIARGNSEGMHTLDQDLRKLYESNLVELDIARAAAHSPNDFMRSLQVM
ncbi:MAG: PilT/PilU family type 4a pilus ATPase [Deltaproteobacteria bacterium]|nr:PilT/PilU family type 4a pilus ATPase [Deltaproteobacteria bacterium]